MTENNPNDAPPGSDRTRPPLIGISMGDAAGVGPELCLQMLANTALRELCTPVVFGDARLLNRVADACALPAPKCIVPHAKWDASQTTSPTLIDCETLTASDVHPGLAQAHCGTAAFEYIRAATTAAVQQRTAAIVTAPINKHAMHLAGIEYPGHTEMIADLTDADDVRMMFAADDLVVTLVTIHVGYAEVPGLLTRESVLRTITMTARALRRLERNNARITVCGLNPHAAEKGLFGREEITIIQPAIEEARRMGLDVSDPLPPDTAFIPDVRRHTGAYIAMFHDQGLIPFKILAFSKGVNITLGLPIVRTSPDHGTAYDIAWKGKASTESMEQSIRWALRLAAH